MTDSERVAFLLGPDGVAAFGELLDEDEQATTISNALTEYRDARLAAAYILELVCADQRQRAVAAAVGAKKIKVGSIEIQKAGSGETVNSVNADALCARAKVLRREYRRATSGIQFASPLQVPR